MRRMRDCGVTCIVCGMPGCGVAVEYGGVGIFEMVGRGEACGKEVNRGCADE